VVKVNLRDRNQSPAPARPSEIKRIELNLNAIDYFGTCQMGFEGGMLLG